MLKVHLLLNTYIKYKLKYYLKFYRPLTMNTLSKEPQQDRKPVFTGDEGAPIPLKQASEWTANYRTRFPDEVLSYFFGFKIIDQIMKQEDCIGIRIYYANSKPLSSFQSFIVSVSNFLLRAVGAPGEKHLLVVGTDKYGNDQLPGHSDARSAMDSVKSMKTKSDHHTEERTMALESRMADTESTGSNSYIIAEMATPCPGAANCPKNQMTRDSE